LNRQSLLLDLRTIWMTVGKVLRARDISH
jgi:hypothetical protein